MAEHWRDDSALVLFHDDNVEEPFVIEVLSAVDGFQSLHKLLRTFPIAIVNIREGSYESFSSTAIKLPSVQHVHPDYYLEPASYTDAVSPDYTCGSFKPVLRNLHNLGTPNRREGIGVRVAIIDSGIAPHPYLPATSFEEVNARQMWPESILNNAASAKLIEDLENDEAGRDPKYRPLSSEANGATQSSFNSKTLLNLHAIEDAINQEWLDAAEAWYDEEIKNTAASMIGSVRTPDAKPSVQLHHHWMGMARRIGIDSYNFVDENLNLEDEFGHGTNAVGILGGWCPDTLRNDALLSRYYVPVEGIVPSAELVILKIYNTTSSRAKSACISRLYDALEHLLNLVTPVHVVYIGVTWSPRHLLKTDDKGQLENYIQLLSQQDVAVVCPAANMGSEGLYYPAAFDEALAVTCTQLNEDGTYSRYHKSCYADSGLNQEVFLTAVCEQEAYETVSTDLLCGFAPFGETSAAAAVVAGVLARIISAHYLNTLTATIDHQLERAVKKARFQLVKAPTALTLPVMSLDDLKSEAIRLAKNPMSATLPSVSFGHGVANCP